MAIDYVPGPFSFLTTLGQAGGAAFKAAEDFRQQRTKEAMDVAGLIMRGVEGGYLPRSVLSSKEVSSVFGQLFQGKPNAPPAGLGYVPSPQEALAGPQADYFGQIGQGKLSPTEERQALTGKIPTMVEAGTEAQQAGAIQTGQAAGRAVTGVPSEPVATEAEQGKLREGFVAEAPGFVALAMKGQEITPQNFDQIVNDAYAAYAADQSIGAAARMPEAMARRYLAAALQEQMDKQYELRTRRTGAERPFASGDPELRDIDRQIDNYRQQIAGFQARRNAAVQSLGIPEATARLAARQGGAVGETYGKILEDIDAADAAIGTANAAIQSLEGRYTGGLNVRSPTRYSPQGESLEDRRRSWENDAALVRRNWVDKKYHRQLGNPQGNETVDQYITRTMGAKP